MLKATSQRFQALCIDNVVALPEGTDEESVRCFVKHLEAVAIHAGCPKLRHMSLSSSTALEICALGKLFGVEKYTSHILQAFKDRLAVAELPDFEDVDALLDCPDQDPTMLRITLQKLARASRHEISCDLEALNEFLNSCPALKDAVDTINDKRRPIRLKLHEIGRDKEQYDRQSVGDSALKKPAG